MAYIPPELLKCVVFIGYRDQAGEYHFAGSGFWVSRPGQDDLKDHRLAYCVTAWHVIQKVKEGAKDDRVWLRVNTKNEGQKWIETPKQCWHSHPSDSTVDLAISKIGIDGLFDHMAWPLESLVLKDNLDISTTGDRKIELGDELCVAGLFYPHKGERRNIPIVRIGNVAALRDERVLNRDNVLMDLYLVESRSIGGLSGSPVFIDIITAKNVSPPSHGFSASAYERASTKSFKLFGIVHGHFGDDVEMDAVADDGKTKVGVNFGIAMVIPAEKINEMLVQFAEQEKLEATELSRRRCFVIPDSTPTGGVANSANATLPIPSLGVVKRDDDPR
jgi:hypothetical protein